MRFLPPSCRGVFRPLGLFFAFLGGFRCRVHWGFPAIWSRFVAIYGFLARFGQFSASRASDPIFALGSVF
jgi:hypothetical protein